jgi:hypothetical protein
MAFHADVSLEAKKRFCERAIPDSTLSPDGSALLASHHHAFPQAHCHCYGSIPFIAFFLFLCSGITQI